MQLDLKYLLPLLGVVALFLVLASIYFYPQFQGKVLNQIDTANWEATTHEGRKYQDSTGQQAMWTNAIFGGMPMFQIAFSHPGNLLTKVDQVTKLFLDFPVAVFFALMLFCFLSLLLIGIDFRVAAITSIGLAFSVYFLGLAKAGHNSKLNALVYGTMVFADSVTSDSPSRNAAGSAPRNSIAVATPSTPRGSIVTVCWQCPASSASSPARSPAPPGISADEPRRRRGRPHTCAWTRCGINTSPYDPRAVLEALHTASTQGKLLAIGLQSRRITQRGAEQEHRSAGQDGP